MSTPAPFEYLPIAVRAWPDGGGTRQARTRTGDKFVPYRFLVFDTETTSDPSQCLNFGSAQVITIRFGARYFDEPKVEEEVVFYADDLPGRYPDGYQVLVSYCARHDLRLVSRAEFVQQYVTQAYRIKGRKTPPRLALACFNAPFDLSRIAVRHGLAQGKLKDGFAFYLKNDSTRTVSVKHLDSKKQLIKGADVLDLRTLVFAMTNKAPNLIGACKLFQIPEDKAKGQAQVHGLITPDYIHYNRRDVTATAWLTLEALRLYNQHPVSLSPLNALSPASLAKAYYEAMGIPPLAGRKGILADPVVLGNVMSSYFGGRAECHIRNVIVPVAVRDYTSMYPTVNANLGLWRFVIANSIDVHEQTGQVQAFLDSVTLADMLRPETWPCLTGFALTHPNGDVLPVRAAYAADGGTTNVGVNYLHSAAPLWYSLPDLVASKLLTAKTPEISRAIFFTPHGDLPSLESTSLIGTVRIYPAREDFFTRVIEQRANFKTSCVHGRPDQCTCTHCRTEEFLKVLANSGSYGIFMQMTRTDLDKNGAQQIYGAFDEPWQYTGTAFETAGAYSYPPIGALITSSARLMLAILEKLVTDEAGSWAFCDTDSMAVVATEDGGETPCAGVTALSYSQVAQIQEKLNALNPYSGPAGKTLLKPESDCYAYVISAKRYALFRYIDGKPVVFKYMEHGLGLYLNPADINSDDRRWMQQLWQYIVDHAHGIDTPLPEWIGCPALTRSSVSSPHLLNVFSDYNDGRDYAEQVKPFGFMLLASEYGPIKAIEGRKLRRVVTGYTPDRLQWETADWYDLHDPAAPPIRIGGSSGMPVKTFRQVLREFIAHPEAKCLGSDGLPCSARATGLLSRRTVRVSEIQHVGKESNKLEEVEDGLIDAWDDVITSYGSPASSDPARAVISSLPTRIMTDVVNLATGRFREWRSGKYATGYLGIAGASIPLGLYHWDYRNRITWNTIQDYTSGKSVSTAVQQQLERLAAYIVIDTTGIEPATVNWSGRRKLHTPKTVLAAWNEAGRPNPWPWNASIREPRMSASTGTMMCACGCGRPLARTNQRYYKRSCYEKTRRLRAVA